MLHPPPRPLPLPSRGLPPPGPPPTNASSGRQARGGTEGRVLYGDHVSAGCNAGHAPCSSTTCVLVHGALWGACARHTCRCMRHAKGHKWHVAGARPTLRSTRGVRSCGTVTHLLAMVCGTRATHKHSSCPSTCVARPHRPPHLLIMHTLTHRPAGKHIDFGVSRWAPPCNMTACRGKGWDVTALVDLGLHVGGAGRVGVGGGTDFG